MQSQRSQAQPSSKLPAASAGPGPLRPVQPPVPQGTSSPAAVNIPWSFSDIPLFASGQADGTAGDSSDSSFLAASTSSMLPHRASSIAVSGSSHPSERAADQLAGHVTGSALPGQALAEGGYAVGPAASYLRSLQGGEALAPDLRASLEPKFGRPLGQVRLHTDPSADRAARDLGANAFAYGSHIGFSAGRFDPASVDGGRLLAHEIAHTLEPRSYVSRQVAEHAQAPGVAQVPDGPEPDPIRPTASGAGRLRQEANGVLTEFLHGQIADETTRDTTIGNATYLIVGNRVSWYRSDGSLIYAFGLKADAHTWPSGIYLRTPNDVLLRFVRLNGNRVFAPWVWSDADVGLMINWLRPQDVSAFREIIDSVGSGPVMVVIPEQASATRRDTRQAQRLVEQVRQRMSDRAGTAAGSSSGTPSASSSSATSTSSPDDPARTPQQRIGDPPDRITVSSTETNVSVNVTVDRAHTSVEVDDSDTVSDLEQSIQSAADQLRRSRDASQSDSIAGGATTTEFAQDDGGPHPRLAERIGNAPRYPSSITNYGPQITVPGATSQFSMELDFARAGSDLLSQVTARMQTIQYYWELLDVTHLNPEDRDDAANQTVGSGNRVTNLDALKNDLSHTESNIEEDTSS